MKTSSSRAGFTLVESIFVLLLGMVVLGTSYQVLTTNIRAFTVLGARIENHQTVQSGADVMFAELREISPSGGDLISMGADSLTIRTMRSFGVACVVSLTGTPQVTVERIGRWMNAADSIFLFAENDPRIATDDVWLAGLISAIDTTVTCPSGAAAQRLQLSGMGAAMAVDTVRVGAPVRSFEHFWYGLHQRNNRWYLGRRAPGGSAQPLVGPLLGRSRGGLALTYFDAFGSVTTTPTDVAGIQVVLRAVSEVRDMGGDAVGDSSTTFIHPRN